VQKRLPNDKGQEIVIEDFANYIQKKMDKKFEESANMMLNANRGFEHNRAVYLAGICDGVSASSDIMREAYKLFVTQQSEEDNDIKSLY